MFFYIRRLWANILLAVQFSFQGKSLREVIWQDPLTSAVNGFAVEKHGLPDKREIVGEFVVIFIDINKFKTINDRFGHEQGDKALIRVTQTLERTFSRRHDTVICRLGGDEFIVFLPKTPRWFAELAMTKVNRELSPISVSFGIEVCSSWEALPLAKHNADIRMYAMKHG